MYKKLLDVEVGTYLEFKTAFISWIHINILGTLDNLTSYAFKTHNSLCGYLLNNNNKLQHQL